MIKKLRDYVKQIKRNAKSILSKMTIFSNEVNRQTLCMKALFKNRTRGKIYVNFYISL